MSKRIVTTRTGHKRTNICPVRMSDHEKKIAIRRQERANFRTLSAYLRALAVAGREPEKAPAEIIRDLRNEVILLTDEIRNSKSSRSRDRALYKAIDTLDRISRI